MTPRELTNAAISAALHCLTGCAIGEILGMVISTALGWHNAGNITLSIALAFFFGYALAMRPVLAAGLSFRRAPGARDTRSPRVPPPAPVISGVCPLPDGGSARLA